VAQNDPEKSHTEAGGKKTWGNANTLGKGRGRGTHWEGDSCIGDVMEILDETNTQEGRLQKNGKGWGGKRRILKEGNLFIPEITGKS